MGFTHHKVDLTNEVIECEKALCFVLDPSQDEREAKKRKVTKKDKKGSAVTYGAKLNLQKASECPAMKIGWRVRREPFQHSMLFDGSFAAGLRLAVGHPSWYLFGRWPP